MNLYSQWRSQGPIIRGQKDVARGRRGRKKRGQDDRTKKVRSLGGNYRAT